MLPDDMVFSPAANGLQVRDYVAILAMQSMLNISKAAEVRDPDTQTAIARAAYDMADALILASGRG